MQGTKIRLRAIVIDQVVNEIDVMMSLNTIGRLGVKDGVTFNGAGAPCAVS